MQDILVLGAGKIGALICGLLAESGDYHVQLGDAQPGAAADVAKAHGNENIRAFDIDATDKAALSKHVRENKIVAVVSSLPYYCNLTVAEVAREEGLHYFDMTEEDRTSLHDFIASDDAERFVITHGTDTMPETAEALEDLQGKTIVLTGALTPARFKTSDANFNVGMAVAAAQVAPPGVYIAMSGQVFSAGNVRKNRADNRFEPL